MQKTPFLFLTALLTAASLACSLSGSSPAKPTISVDANAVGTAVAKTVAAAIPSLQPTDKPSQTSTPSLTPKKIEATIMPQTASIGLHAAFIDSTGDLWSWAEGNTPTRLTNSGGIYGVSVAPDGSQVVFNRPGNTATYSLWMANRDGSELRRLLSEGELAKMSAVKDSAGARADNLTWLPGTHTLAFNITPTFDGPGLQRNNDLWLLDTDRNDLRQLLPPGKGGMFTFSPNGQKIAVITPEKISLVNADGTGRKEVLSYPQVITYSEYLYYPEPHWAPDSNSLMVAIPPADPLADPPQKTTVYRIAADGSPAIRMGEISVNFLTPVAFAPDLTKLAYLSSGTQPASNILELHIAPSDLNGDRILATGEVTQPVWAPDSNRLAYTLSGSERPTLAVIESGDLPLVDVSNALDIHWVDDQRVMFLHRSGSVWQLRLGAVNSISQVIADLGSSDQWIPSFQTN
jgi:Tol biopolymer transport system component